MLAARLRWADGQFALRQIPIPRPRRGEALIKVMAAGVCLSDVHMIHGLKPRNVTAEEVTLGHETAGLVVEVGPDVDGWDEGDRVVVGSILGAVGQPRLTMGVHFDGGWAEYTAVPVELLEPMPDTMTFDEAAIVPDAVSTPWGTIRDVARVKPAETAGVWGVGGLGSHMVRLLRLVGAAPIVAVDPLPAARERALAFGADAAFDPASPSLAADIRAVTGPRGLDVAFDVAGFGGVVEQILELLAPRGRVSVTGISALPIAIEQSVQFIGAERQILGHYGYSQSHVAEVVKLARLGRLDLAPSISRTMPLAAAAEAVRDLEDKRGDPIRIVLHPSD
ncbi:MAG: zinc-binding dehydrogenase [Bifidobacteriaceae bacterium]|jgi:threonine dehydrogenase-like Zn-dependent dehydrogenase|nr:zinc-binding dehydrogenase [Bifidobacteriaceae bacterium]